MDDSKLPRHISFQILINNPYVTNLYEGLKSMIPDSYWWITDEHLNLIPFPRASQNALPHQDEESLNTHKQLMSECKNALETDDTLSSTTKISKCCNGYIQGISCFRFRNHFVGGLGISHVPEEQRELFKRQMKIIEGYLSLLASTLEDHEDLELVHSVWSETLTVVNLDELLRRLLREIIEALSLDSGMILLINEDGEFYPAAVNHYPSNLLIRRDLDISRHDYFERLLENEYGVIELDKKDPIRLWLKRSLENEGYTFPTSNPTCVAVPFFRNRYLIGMFVSFIDFMRGLSETKKYLLRILSTGGAAALDNALTLERMSQRRRALSTIHVVHRLISSSITFKDLLPKIGQLTRQLLKAKKCSIMIFNHRKQRLYPEVCLGLEEGEVGQKPLELGEGLPGWVAENFNPVIFHPRGESHPSWKESGDQYPSDSYLSVALFDADIEGVITIAEKDGNFTPGDREILVTFAEQAVIAMRNAKINEGERSVTVRALRSIANLIETHDPSHAGISATTCKWAQNIAAHLHLNEREKRHLVYASLLHDTGSLRAFQTNTNKEEMKRYRPLMSLRFVQSLGLSKEVGQIVYHANENWDGSGYPDQLKENEIPLGSRIIAVANTFATLLFKWKNRYGHQFREQELHDRALRLLYRLADRTLDRDVVNALEQALHNPIKEEEYFL